VPGCRLSFVFLDCSVARVVISVITYTSCEYNTGTLLLSTDVAGVKCRCRNDIAMVFSMFFKLMIKNYFHCM
jgi:hypothetical protein